MFRHQLLVLVAVLTGCIEVPLEPVSPSWDIQVSAALARSSHSIRDLVGGLADLPPEVLDTLNLTAMTIRFEKVVVVGDTTGDGVDDTGLTPEFFQSISDAAIFVEAENGTPAAMVVSMEMLGAAKAVLLRIPENPEGMSLPAAPLDETGKVGPATTVGSTVQFDEGLSRVIETAQTISYTVDLSFPEGVTAAHILGADSLSIRVWGTFVSRVDP